MPQAQITSMTPEGSFSTQNGEMYKFGITFSDGTTGVCNAKSPNPPYRVGDERVYTITGNLNGRNKLKIDRTDSQRMARNHQQPQQPQYDTPPANPQPSYYQPAQNAGNPTQWRPQGATVGMSVVQACEFSRVLGKGFDKQFIYETASALLRISQKLEAGHLAAIGQAPTPAPQYAPPPAPAQQTQQAGKPRPGPDGSAFPEGSHPDFESSDAPF